VSSFDCPRCHRAFYGEGRSGQFFGQLRRRCRQCGLKVYEGS
jgi:hypothetical protein